MLCETCGTDNPSGSIQCQSCGRALVSAGTTVNFPLRQNESGSAGSPTAPAQSGAHLMVVKGSHSEQEIQLVGTETVMGRDPESSIFLNDVTVSRKHAEISMLKDRFTIKDLGSLNGTYLNGERVDEAELKSGDELWIGKYKMIFVIGE